MLTAIALLAQAAVSPPNADTALPDLRDIPVGFSSVICKDAQTAQRMFNDYYKLKPVRNNFATDTTLFLRGLKETDCEQKSQIKDRRDHAIRIDKVHQRKTHKLTRRTKRYIRYSGVWDDGRPVHGIVDEGWNNRFPRTELATWLSHRTQDGWLSAESGQQSFAPIFYRCDSVKKARNAVKTLKSTKPKSDKGFESDLAQAAQKQGCRMARESYFVIEKFELAERDCGHECWYEINALEAIDRSGQRIGLIFDGSLM